MIRRAAVADASRLAEILIFAKRAAYRPIFQDDLVSFQKMQVLDLALHYQNAPGALEDVYVYDDGVVKGMMSWRRSRDGAAETEWAWELRELYVDPFFQGRGVGRVLITDFLACAADHRVGKTYLRVLEKNTAARHFYETLGFRPNGERELENGTEEYVLFYVKTL